MNRFLFIFLLFPFYSFFAQNEIDSSYIYCKYEISFVKDTTDDSTRNYELAILLIGKNSSLFRSQVKHESDSIRNEVAQKAFANQSMANEILQELRKAPRAKYEYEVYKNAEFTKIYSKILSEKYAFESEKKIDWKLIHETKIISSYRCSKAIGKYGNKTIIAWYTHDVPIPEGPYSFKGLPGLIIEAYDENKHNHFTLKQLKRAKMVINHESKAIETTYDKFLKKRKEFKDNPSGIFSSRIRQSMKEQMTKEKSDEYDKRMRKENNYLD